MPIKLLRNLALVNIKLKNVFNVGGCLASCLTFRSFLMLDPQQLGCLLKKRLYLSPQKNNTFYYVQTAKVVNSKDGSSC